MQRQPNYTHIDWIHFKRAHKLKNKDVAEIIGMAESSVRNQTQPNNELPRWAILAIYTWMQNKSNFSILQ